MAVPGVIVGLLAAVGFVWVAQQCVHAVGLRREASFKRRLTEANGGEALDFLDNETPYDLPQELLDALPPSLLVSWCVSGRRGGERVVYLRYVMGYRRQWAWMHVVAVRREHPERAVNPVRAKAVSKDGHWVMVNAGWGLTVRRLVQLWDSLKTVFGEEGEALQRKKQVPGGVVIRPRHEM